MTKLLARVSKYGDDKFVVTFWMDGLSAYGGNNKKLGYMELDVLQLQALLDIVSAVPDGEERFQYVLEDKVLPYVKGYHLRSLKTRLIRAQRGVRQAQAHVETLENAVKKAEAEYVASVRSNEVTDGGTA